MTLGIQGREGNPGIAAPGVLTYASIHYVIPDTQLSQKLVEVSLRVDRIKCSASQLNGIMTFLMALKLVVVEI
jgi:hypothetical protein